MLLLMLMFSQGKNYCTKINNSIFLSNNNYLYSSRGITHTCTCCWAASPIDLSPTQAGTDKRLFTLECIVRDL